MRSRALLGLLSFVLAALAMGASGEPEEPAEWELRKEGDGIRVFTRDSHLPGLKTVRAETVLPIDDPYAVVALLADEEASVELMDTVSFVEEVESDEPGTNHMRMVLDMPWPIKDRDVVAAMTMVHDEENRRFIMTLTGKPELIPVNSKYVRVPSFDSSYTLRYGREDGVHVTFESTVDPGGSIPAWVMNYGITGMPVNTLTNMRRLVTREKYQGQEERLRPLVEPLPRSDAEQGAPEASSGEEQGPGRESE
jgi:hypothetical protein